MEMGVVQELIRIWQWIGYRDEGNNNTSALDDWVFNPDPSYPDEMNAGVLKPRSQSTASRSMLRSKLSAKAGWDKLSLVFMTYHHPGQA